MAGLARQAVCRAEAAMVDVAATALRQETIPKAMVVMAAMEARAVMVAVADQALAGPASVCGQSMVPLWSSMAPAACAQVCLVTVLATAASSQFRVSVPTPEAYKHTEMIGFKYRKCVEKRLGSRTPTLLNP